MQAPPPILMLTGTPPGHSGVGEIVLAEELGFLAPAQVSLFATLPKLKLRLDLNTFSLAAVQLRDRRYEHLSSRVAGHAGTTAAYLATRLCFQQHVRRLSTAAIEFGKRQQSQRLWAVLDCPTTIFMARRVAEALKIPLRPLIWDSPELFIAQLGWDRRSGSSLLREFEQLLKASEKIAVIGESMQAEYARRYGMQGIIVRHGLPETTTPLVNLPTDRSEYRIGFAGSITAPDALAQLIQGLNQQNWQIAGKNVTLRLIGCRYLCESAHPQRIEYLGRLKSVDDTVQALRECDALYLPQPFDAANDSLSRWSFPTKLSTYLAAGRPVLVHAPPVASLVEFHRRYQFGVCTTSLDDAAVMADLTRLLTDHNLIQHACTEGQRCLREELNLDRFRERFTEFLIE